MNVTDLLIEPFTFTFMVNASWALLAASVVCSVLSCWLVLIGWSLMGDAVSHAVLPGVVLAHIIGLPFALGAVAFGLASVALIGAVRARGTIKEDAAIGIVFTTMFAAGLVLISVTPSQTDLMHIVFGNLLGIGQAELRQILGIAVIVLSVLVVKRRDLTLMAFDRIHAHAMGINPARLNALLLIALALTAVVALQVVGVILVVALLIIPGATASLLTRSISRMLVVAPVFSVLSSLIGLLASYHLDTAPGGTVVLVHGLGFALVFLGQWLRSSRRLSAAESVG